MSTFREPLFNFDTLTNADNVVTWLLRTNDIIDGMNSLYVRDVYQGDGICTTTVGGVITVNVDPGPAIAFTAANKLTLSFIGVSQLSSATTTSPVLATDRLLLDRSGVLRSVATEAILPPTIKHQHTFSETIKFDNDIWLNETKIEYSAGDRWNSEIKAGGIGSLEYQGFDSIWYFNNNIGLGTSDFYGIVSDSILNNTESVFNFCTHINPGALTSTNADNIKPTGISFNFNVGTAPAAWNAAGVGSTTEWPATWKLKFSENTAGFYNYTPTSTDGDDAVLTMQKIGLFDNIVNINGKIYISDIQNSSQFISGPTGTANKVPLTNSSGLLDKKFTNRISTTDFAVTPSVGDLVVVSTLTDGDAQYSLGIADGIGSSDIIGIVESISANVVTLVLSGEFAFVGAASLTPGSKYYLSQTSAGDFVEEGTYSSGIIRPVFVALTSSTGIILASSSSVTTGIGSVTVNYGEGSAETIDIDSINYPLRFVAGTNIGFNVTTNNEIEISTTGLAGSQDVFRTINVPSGTDLVASGPTDTLNLTSTTLTITGNSATDTINFEIPNTFKTFKFSRAGASDLTYNPESTTDTLQFIAGNGISFTQNTDDSVIIASSVTGSVSVEDIVFPSGDGYEIFVSDANGVGTAVSLLGSAAAVGGFDANWSTVSNLNVPGKMRVIDQITYDAATSNYTFKGEEFSLDSTYNDVLLTQYYLPDELAGFMVGRITPSATGDNVTFPSNSISRLTRRDVRFFLGINPEGYIDSVNNVYRTWTIDSGASFVNAESKSGVLRFEAGTGIALSNPTPGSSDRIVISNTGVAQNAFSHVVLKNSSGTIIDSYDANTSADTFTLKAGTFVKLDTDTNNDTVTFDLDVPYDYALLGNSGTTDGMGIIDLSGSASCLVGRIGGSQIQAIDNSELRWISTTPPVMPLPYFGLVRATHSATATFKNLNASTAGQLTLVPGSGVSFVVNDETNTITINSSGTTGPQFNPFIATINENNNLYSVSTSGSNLTFMNGTGVGFSSANDEDGNIQISTSLAQIPPRSLLANSTLNSAVPAAFSLANGAVLFGDLLTGLISLPASPAAEADIASRNSLKSKLNIGHYNTIIIQNSAGTLLTRLATTNISGDGLRLVPGTNMSISTTGQSDIAISTVGTVQNVIGAGPWTGTIAGMDDGSALTLNVGSTIKANGAGGSIGGNGLYGTVTVTSISSNGKSLTFRTTSGQPINGAVTSIRTESSTNGILTFNSSTVLSTDLTPTFASVLFSGIGRGTEVFYGTTGSNINTQILNVTKLNITDGTTPTPITSSVLHKEMISNEGLGATISTVIVDAFSGRTSQKYLPGVNFTESIYGASYTLRVQDYAGTTPQVGDLSLEGDVVTITSGSTGVNFDGAGTTININSKSIKATTTFPLLTSSGTTMEILCKSVTSAGAFANFTMTNATAFKINVNGSANTSNLIITGSGINQTLTSTGTITIDANTTFGTAAGTSRTITFTNCSFVGLPAAALHADTHRSVGTEANNSGAIGTDQIPAWKVGAVARATPVLLNKIAIAKQDGFYNQPVTLTDAELYGGETYETVFGANVGATNHGPMYVVLANGQESFLSSTEAEGPPGQIIMIRKV